MKGKMSLTDSLGGEVVIIIGVRDNKKLVWVDSSKVSRKEGI